MCSLSTSTPLQSKITTGAPRRRACSTAVVSTNRGATEGIVGPWQKSGAARPRDVFTQLLRFAGKARIIVRRGRKWPEKRLALLWQFFAGTGFPNHFFCDSWVVGFLEGPTMVSRTSDWRDELGRWLKPFLDRLGHKARRQMCPLYVSGLIGPGDRKSVQPMAKRLALGAC